MAVVRPSGNTGVDLGFDNCLCHYLRGLLPSLVGKVGLVIPDPQLVALALGAGAPRGRICENLDGYGLQLEFGDGEPARRPNQRALLRHPRRHRCGELPGASTETKGLFAHVLPQVVL